MVTKMDGTKYSIHKPQLLATNGRIHNIMEIVTKLAIDKLRKQDTGL